jgi:hypothetical protein
MRRNVNIAEMGEDQRRAYDSQRQAEYRQRKKEAVEKGAAAPNVDIARDLLADIAIMMLATDALGANTIMKALNRYYDGSGWPAQIKRRARSKKLKTKVFKLD